MFSKRYKRYYLVVILLGLALISEMFYLSKIKRNTNKIDGDISLPYIYNFNSPGTLYEADEMNKSASKYWWVDSGAYISITNSVGKTVQGSLGNMDPWRLLYFKTNPIDTDQGYYPQNIFRLISRFEFDNFDEEAYFFINSDNLSTSPNRNESNALLLFSRYIDSNNLYYAGLRVDGSAVIKKKKNGTYFTIAMKNVFGDKLYDKNINPNSLPKKTWLGIKVVTKNNEDGTVNIRLYTDIGRTNKWSLALEGVDDNKTFGGKAIKSKGYAGIRTDFMDVFFSDFKINGV